MAPNKLGPMRSECKRRGLPATGTAAELEERLKLKGWEGLAALDRKELQRETKGRKDRWGKPLRADTKDITMRLALLENGYRLRSAEACAGRPAPTLRHVIEENKLFCEHWLRPILKHMKAMRDIDQRFTITAYHGDGEDDVYMDDDGVRRLSNPGEVIRIRLPDTQVLLHYEYKIGKSHSALMDTAIHSGHWAYSHNSAFLSPYLRAGDVVEVNLVDNKLRGIRLTEQRYAEQRVGNCVISPMLEWFKEECRKAGGNVEAGGDEAQAMLCFQHKINEEVQRWKDNIAVLEKEVAELERQKAELSEQTKREEKSQERAQAEDAAGQQATMTDKPEQTQQYADSAEQLPEEQEQEREQADRSDIQSYSAEENEEVQDFSEWDRAKQRCIQDAPQIRFVQLPESKRINYAEGSNGTMVEEPAIPAGKDPRLHDIWNEMNWFGTKKDSNLLEWSLQTLQGEANRRTNLIKEFKNQGTYNRQMSWLKQEHPDNSAVDVLYEALQILAGALRNIEPIELRKRTGQVCEALVHQYVELANEVKPHKFELERVTTAIERKQQIIKEDNKAMADMSGSEEDDPTGEVALTPMQKRKQYVEDMKAKALRSM